MGVKLLQSKGSRSFESTNMKMVDKSQNLTIVSSEYALYPKTVRFMLITLRNKGVEVQLPVAQSDIKKCRLEPTFER
jgi:hypothetical protein